MQYLYCYVAIGNKLKHAPSEYMKKLYFDAISYDPKILQALINLVGPDRVMFGTDNPFFPPVGADDIFASSLWSLQ